VAIKKKPLAKPKAKAGSPPPIDYYARQQAALATLGVTTAVVRPGVTLVATSADASDREPSLPPPGTVVHAAFPAVPDQSSGFHEMQTFAPAPVNPSESTSLTSAGSLGRATLGASIMKWIVPVVVGLVVWFLTRGIGWALLAAVAAFFAAAWWAKRKAAATAPAQAS
jgi:hypothetical protein